MIFYFMDLSKLVNWNLKCLMICMFLVGKLLLMYNIGIGLWTSV
jgi:hypothetical protein